MVNGKKVQARSNLKTNTYILFIKHIIHITINFMH